MHIDVCRPPVRRVLPMTSQQGEPCGTLPFPRSAFGDVPVKRLCDPLLWLIVLFLLLLFWIYIASRVLRRFVFPILPRPVTATGEFAALALAHFWLVGISSLFAAS